MKRLAIAVVVLSAACTSHPKIPPGAAGVFDGTGGGWVDLTWPADSAASYVATSMEGPATVVAGRLTADRVPLQELMGPVAVVDVSARADAGYQVSLADLKEWESLNGQLPNGGILLLRTGWDTRHGDRAAYLGTDLTGSDASAHMRFPGLSPEAARWLVDKRGILAVGIDTPSLDRGGSATPEVRRLLYRENIAGFDNVANLDLLPPSGSYAVALPERLRGGGRVPLRIVAFIPG